MANYAITDHVTVTKSSIEGVTALLETYLETVDDSKTIHKIDIVQTNGGSYIGYVLHGG